MLHGITASSHPAGFPRHYDKLQLQRHCDGSRVPTRNQFPWQFRFTVPWHSDGTNVIHFGHGGFRGWYPGTRYAAAGVCGSSHSDSFQCAFAYCATWNLKANE
eukprot:2332864-Rhodomonas_salina.1